MADDALEIIKVGGVASNCLFLAIVSQAIEVQS
jgi:hypothetical protein